jgi:hypothetical protein
MNNANVPENDLTGEALEEVRSDAAEALKPDGLSDKEWEAVRRMRAEEAEERRRVMVWRLPLAELRVAAEDDDEDARDRAAHLFIDRVLAHGWDVDDEISNFCDALMRADGYRQVSLRNHGWVWTKR